MMRVGLASVTLALVLSATPARAEVFSDIGLALDFAGFDLQGANNPISGGFDTRAVANFANRRFDFGFGDLTLTGPISVEFSTGTRLVDTWELSFQTATTSLGNAVPLSYTLNVDSGSQQSQVAGTILLDGGVSFNQFGFYHVTLDYSSRQTTTTDGRFADDQQFFDVDAGPIDIRGNIIADVLAVITDPLFAAADAPNPFASFSGREQLQKMMEDSAFSAQQRLLSGNVSSDELTALVNGAVLNQITTSLIDTSAGTAAVAAAEPGQPSTVIPEPTTLVLCAAGLVALVTRRRKS